VVRHEYRAARAVLSAIHVTHLRAMAPGSSWPEELHTGAPGRNAAMVLLRDLGHDPADGLSPDGHGQGW
jgi:hypothetical protein